MYHPSRRTNLVPTSMSLIRIYKYYYDIVCVFFVGIEFKVNVKNTSYDVILILVWHFCLDFSKYYFGVQLDSYLVYEFRNITFQIDLVFIDISMFISIIQQNFKVGKSKLRHRMLRNQDLLNLFTVRTHIHIQFPNTLCSSLYKYKFAPRKGKVKRERTIHNR